MASTIQDFSDKVSAAFDALGASVDGVAADVDALKAEIAKLQGTAGQITPEDQALLDGIQSRAATLSEKVKALDDATASDQVPTP